jgi:predicted negative regulator of RcsB-dependent stress response
MTGDRTSEEISGDQEKEWWQKTGGIVLIVSISVLLLLVLTGVRVWKVKKFGAIGFFV